MFKTPLVLERCTIREWRADDAASLVLHANDREVSCNLRDIFPYPYTSADAAKFLEQVVTAQPATKFCIDIGGSAVGGISFRLGADVHRHTAELGYWLSRQYWGRGIMTEVVRVVTDAVFHAFDLRRIYAESFSNNPSSVRVLEKAGFVFEGRMKNHVVKDGQILDSLLYARTR